MNKAPSITSIETEARYTKDFINQILEAKREGRNQDAAELCNEISAMWAGLMNEFEIAD